MSKSITSSPEDCPSVPPVTSQRFRWKSGLIWFVLCTSGTIIANSTASSDTDRMIRTYEGIGVSIVILLIWWLVFSGIRFWVRLAVVSVSAFAIAAFGFLSIRKVEFTGDMRPKFRFTWDSPSPSEKARDWLREHAPKESTDIENQQARPGLAGLEVTSGSTIEITLADWPQYCGFDGSRQVFEEICSFDWQQQPPTELWRHPVGDAWSSFAIVGNRLFTQEQREARECVVCYAAGTGIELWRHEDAARYETAQGGIGPRATPTVTGKAVFSLGATGILNALNPATGEEIWQRNICEDAESSMVEWGMSGSPFVFENTIIVDAGGQKGKAVIAYHQSTGEIAWTSGNHQAGYATPRIEVINGVPQLLIFHGDGLEGLDPSNGKKLWKYPWTNQYKINVAQPMRFGNQLFLSSGYDSGCVLIDPTKLQDGRPAEAWSPNKNLKLKFNEAVQRGGFVYGLDDGILACIEAETGERQWKGGRYRHGQVLLWSDKLIVQAESGDIAVVEATPVEFREVARLAALSDRTWNMPIINRGRLYARNASEAVCYQLPLATAVNALQRGE